MQVNFPNQGAYFSNQNISVSEKDQVTSSSEEKTELADNAAEERLEQAGVQKEQQITASEEVQNSVVDLYA